VSLDDTFELQATLQRALDTHPDTMEDPEERIQYIKDMVLALENELQAEFLGEIGWKPWATSRHINTDAAKSELVDAFQFFMNLCFVVGMTAEELMTLHAAKIKKDFARIEEGYDGVSTKCPVCKRAMDDEFVSCEFMTANTGYCQQLRVRNPRADGMYRREDYK
jgi:hypothetical protein